MIDILEEFFKRVKHNESIALVTVVDTEGSSPGKTGSKMLVDLEGLIIGTIGGGILEAKVISLAKKALGNNQSQLFNFSLTKEEASLELEKEAICGGKIKVFIDVIKPRERIIIFGAGHIAIYLSKLANMIGFKVVIIDERDDFANRKRFPEAEQIIVLEPSKAVKKIGDFSSAYIVIVTRGHLKDEESLFSVICHPVKYIGMIGSKQKNETIFEHLKEKGVSREDLDKVFAPIGLDIGAKTPEEIAVSIISEVIGVRSGKIIR